LVPSVDEARRIEDEGERMSIEKIDAALALRRNGKLLLGRDRVKAPEAVAGRAFSASR
jgi:hypothetical protein